MTYEMLLIVLALLFFIVIPGVGAFHVRGRWRGFRRCMIDSSRHPIARYATITGKTDGFLGSYRFIGTLEAIQGDDIIWIHDGTVSMSVDMKGVPVYVLPSLATEEYEGDVERNEEVLPDDMPQRHHWSKFSTLPEGTQVFVGGPLFVERGNGLFRSDRSSPMTVVIFDGERDTLMRRSIWAGRHRNEYWNQFTLVSLLAGAVSLFIVTYFLARQPLLRFHTFAALVLSFSPILPFLPPGFALFFAYRRLWRKGRLNRAERDLLRLPVRYFDDHSPVDGMTTTLPDGETYGVFEAGDIDKAREIAPEAKIRPSLITRGIGTVERFFVFGRVAGPKTETRRCTRPDDPLAECLIVPGEPIDLSIRSRRIARTYEVIALTCFVLCYAMNAVLFFLVLAGRIW